MKLRRLILLALLVAVLMALAHRSLRLWRTVIFHSEDVVSITLPSGVEVQTNRWYDRADLIGESNRLSYV